MYTSLPDSYKQGMNMKNTFPTLIPLATAIGACAGDNYQTNRQQPSTNTANEDKWQFKATSEIILIRIDTTTTQITIYHQGKPKTVSCAMRVVGSARKTTTLLNDISVGIGTHNPNASASYYTKEARITNWFKRLAGQKIKVFKLGNTNLHRIVYVSFTDYRWIRKSLNDLRRSKETIIIECR